MSLRLTRASFLRVAAAADAGALPLSARARGEELFEVTAAATPGRDGSDMAKSFTISGLAESPRVTLNGRPADVRVAGQAFQISLA